MWTPPCDIYYIPTRRGGIQPPQEALIFFWKIKFPSWTQRVSHFTNSHAECNDQHGINSPSLRLLEAGAQEAAHGLHAHREAGHVLDVVLFGR